ncbi:MAG TPA: hypothetical protein VMU11_03410 [Verrucomicrobiae bacterium]|nr:hypothetical protein [Verrucomicrobiae bacterium]
MPDRLLNLRDTVAVCDFIESVLGYLPEKDRKPYEAMVEEMRGDEKAVTQERLAEMARNIGAVTWPRRRALARFVETVGSELEWEGVVKNVRPSTAALLKKLRKDAGAPDLASTLKHPDASTVLKPDMEIEINMIRDEVRADLYEDHQDALEPLIEEAASELEAMKKRLKKIREQADAVSGTQQIAYFDKLADLEDRIYFGGEAIPLEILDAEVQFDAGERVLED